MPNSPQALLSLDPGIPEAAGPMVSDGGRYGLAAAGAQARVIHDDRDRSTEDIDRENAATAAEELRLAPLIEEAEAAMDKLPTATLERVCRRKLTLRGAPL